MSWRVEVEKSACVGAGLCAGRAWEVFEVAGGRSTVLTEVVEPNDDVAEAADICPVQAILVRDVATGDVIAPA